MTAGKLYHFYLTATNEIGTSDPSDEVGRWAASLPSKPTQLRRGSLSTRTQIQLEWDIHLDNAIQVTGYILEADVERNGRFDVIWNG